METTFVFGGKELRANVHRAVQQSARIISQIENERLHSLLLQFIQRLRQLSGRRLVELNQAHISDLEWSGQVRIEQSRALDALHFDLRPLQRVILHFLGRWPN